MNKTFRICIVVLLFSGVLKAQSPVERAKNLEHLRKEFAIEDSLRELRVNQYLEHKQLERSFHSEDGVGYYLEDVSPWGHPLYLRTMNEGAATTVGVDKLRSGGGLGLNLTGKDMRIGIWEVFGVFQTHQEFDNRVLTQEAAGEIDNHATHVAGTLIASGINPDARGMAYEGRALLYTASGDLGEMTDEAAPDQSSLLVSNHSYGPGLGWEFSNGSWRWFGDASVSDQEDYRFGFYNSKARSMDQLAFNAPYYTIVKSAGNDRSDVGDGSRPADGPFDIIGTWGTAKNIVTVGAVSKINSGYEGPSDVDISSFSSYGPTDDGRIKPDIVAAGVNLLSSISSAPDAYGNLSGTSMSAPNAAGAFILLQQLAQQETGNYMRSATLKALIAHTANAATNADGPNYRFGWGLLNAEGAARHIQNSNGVDVVMEELVLQEGQVYELQLDPVRGEKITATIAWTDPAGQVSEISLDPTDLKLVNDLDLRIVDATGNEQEPWILNPASPSSSASRGDNFRDNIEQIEFYNPEPRRYTLRVSHKNTLQNDQQEFSLILTYTRRNNIPSRTLYWVGGDGNWANPAGWSLSSGGAAANTVPSANDAVVIDENSFTADGEVIQLSGNEEVGTLTWLAKGNNGLSMNGQTIAVNGDVLVSSENFSVTTEGTLLVQVEGAFDLGPNALSQLNVVFNAANGNWTVNDLLIVKSIELQRGNVSLSGATAEIMELISTGNGQRSLDITEASISGLTIVDFNGSNFSLSSGEVEMEFSETQDAAVSAPGISISGLLISASGSLEINGNGLSINEVINGGQLVLSTSLSIDTLILDGGSDVLLQSGSVLQITDTWEVNSSVANPVSLSATIAGEIATIDVNSYKKLCFTDMNIESVNYTGRAKVTVGTSSTLDNASGWLTRECSDVLFADFTYSYNCALGLTYLINESSGDISSVTWDLGDGNTLTTFDAYHQYQASGDYEVSLTVVNGSDVETFVQSLPVAEHEPQRNTVVLNDDQLVSERPAESYQWFREGLPIEGANARIYDLENTGGDFFVLTFIEGCNSISDTLTVEVTSIEEFETELFTEETVAVYPVPVQNELNVQWPDNFQETHVVLMDVRGRIYYEERLIPSGSGFTIDMRNMPQGIYLLKIDNSSRNFIQKILKE